MDQPTSTHASGTQRDFDPTRELVGIILAGGAGTRFWPASTRTRPKQFLTLLGERSLLQQSYDRLASFLPRERILVLTSRAFLELAREQLPELPAQNVIGEPVRRDTAAAVALATALCRHRFGDPVMALVTADHLIEPAEEFARTLLSAARGAAEGQALFTLGIEPTHAATGYGYLELGPVCRRDGPIVQHQLLRFVEKPDHAKAREYVDSGRFLWNSGIFVWRTSTIADEFQRHLPKHLAHVLAAAQQDGRPGFDAALEEAFTPLESISIDYAILEKAAQLRCVRASFRWSDVGSFASLAEHLPTDARGNAHRARLFALDAKENIVFSEDEDEIVALVGIDDVVVVRAGHCTLVAPRARAEDIKRLVKELDQNLQ